MTPNWKIRKPWTARPIVLQQVPTSGNNDEGETGTRGSKDRDDDEATLLGSHARTPSPTRSVAAKSPLIDVPEKLV